MKTCCPHCGQVFAVNRWFSASEAATHLRMSRGHVMGLFRNGTIRAEKVPGPFGDQWEASFDAVEAYRELRERLGRGSK